MIEEATKKPQSGWSAPGFEPGTSRMRVSCVTTEPPRSVVCRLNLADAIDVFDLHLNFEFVLFGVLGNLFQLGFRY